VLVDTGMSGIEGIRILKKEFPHPLSIVLTVYGDDERIFNALCAGACGYLAEKDSGGGNRCRRFRRP
jgi:DNA-binding NarL/FixJ family response regulator